LISDRTADPTHAARRNPRPSSDFVDLVALGPTFAFAKSVSSLITSQGTLLMLRTTPRHIGAALATAFVAITAPVNAAGTLTPVGSPDRPIEIRAHHLSVVINNGFARTEVNQTFFNPNDKPLEAIYSFPVPRSASLSEIVIASGENEMHGEVVRRDEAKRIYEEQKASGEEAGVADKNSYQTFEFSVSRVLPNAETQVRFVYYQPLEIDTGVGRYVYPLQHGGTDEHAANFWTRNERVESQFTVDVDLQTAVPIEEIRAPGLENVAIITRIDEGRQTLHFDTNSATLDHDFVLYYRLPSNLPGGVEVIPYRADPTKPGTFMVVVTPGIDLQPLSAGADWCFVLDVSGSMEGKIQTLVHGVSKALGDMHPEDRFRVVTFNDSAREVLPWQSATPQNVQAALEKVGALKAKGSTNLYDGVKLALGSLDADRATSVMLVTDGVANTGVVQPKAFKELLAKQDVRLFGFLIGNSSNWPLMRVICNASGGFFTAVSNEDDIIGQIMLAKSKVAFECLHDASLKISGVKTLDCTDEFLGKIYRGQQLVMFGKYATAGKATLTLSARLTGEDRTYSTTFDFPEIDTEHPEIERLAALNRIEAIEVKEWEGEINSSEAKSGIEALGIEYQLVTDHTSMIVLSDEAHQRFGVERRNRDRVATEHHAQSVRAALPVRSRRIDEAQPMFQGNAPSVTRGGGAIDPFSGATIIVVTVLGLLRVRRRVSAS